MVKYKETILRRYIKPLVLFEDVEQDMGDMLCTSPSSVEQSGSDQTEGKDEGFDSKSATFIFEEDVYESDMFE